jgi:hypothetical protein
MVARFSFVVAVFVFLAISSATSGGVRIASAASQNPAPQTAAPPSPSGMGDMMKMHEKMMADMKAGDARLDALVKSMNAAAGDAKTNAIAAVVNELVQQHKAMHAHMGEMHQHMMGGQQMMGGRGQ